MKQPNNYLCSFENDPRTACSIRAQSPWSAAKRFCGRGADENATVYVWPDMPLHELRERGEEPYEYYVWEL